MSIIDTVLNDRCPYFLIAVFPSPDLHKHPHLVLGENQLTVVATQMPHHQFEIRTNKRNRGLRKQRQKQESPEVERIPPLVKAKFPQICAVTQSPIHALSSISRTANATLQNRRPYHTQHPRLIINDGPIRRHRPHRSCPARCGQHRPRWHVLPRCPRSVLSTCIARNKKNRKNGRLDLFWNSFLVLSGPAVVFLLDEASPGSKSDTLPSDHPSWPPLCKCPPFFVPELSPQLDQPLNHARAYAAHGRVNMRRDIHIGQSSKLENTSMAGSR
jgi:hypothetical protein